MEKKLSGVTPELMAKKSSDNFDKTVVSNVMPQQADFNTSRKEVVDHMSCGSELKCCKK